MSTYNRVFLIGNLAADPETRSTLTGKKVSQFALATNRGKKDKNGEKTKTTDFHRIVSWGPQSELAQKYLKKGRKIFVEGKLVNRTYEDAQGKKHYVTEVVSSHFEFMSSSGNSAPAQNGKSEEGEEENMEKELANVAPADFVTA